MNERALVSVVIPTYNYGRFVREAIDSALAQTYTPLEIIVVDDGSKDDTASVMTSYSENPLVQYIYQENHGLSSARNTGIRAARGGFVALLDADDRWKPDKLEWQLSQFADDEMIGLVYCGRELFDSNGPQGAIRASRRDCERVLEKLTTANIFSPSAAVIRKQCFTTCGLFDEALTKVEDREMWIRIAKRYRFGCVEDCLVEWRIHDSAHSLKSQGMEEAFYTTLRRAFADGPLKGRVLLRAKAYAFMHFDFSWVYHAGRNHLAAWRHVVLSLLCYPLPDWSGKVFQARFARLRRLIRYTLTPEKL